MNCCQPQRESVARIDLLADFPATSGSAPSEAQRPGVASCPHEEVTMSATVSQHGRPAPGVTLVELVIVLAIAALLMAVAVPFYGDWIADYQVLNHAQALAGTMNLARTEAIKRGSRVNLCKSRDLRQCASGGDWDAGYVVYVDTDRDGAVDAGDTALRVQEPAIAGVTIRGNRPVADYVSYTSLGSARMLNGALQMGTFTVCKSGRRAVDVVLANSGRARIQRTAILCP
jgi:type IV fimbrial biogenesis protein FimT